MGSKGMTPKEYRAIFTGLRKTMGTLTEIQRKNLLRIYQEAAKEAGTTLASIADRGVSIEKLQLEAMTELLKKSAQMVADGTNKVTLSLLKDGFSKIGGAQQDLFSTIADRAGLKISGLDTMTMAINNRLIAATVNRTYADGYTYSQKVWGQFDANGRPIGVYGDWVNKIKNIYNLGAAQGIDPVQIARDLEKYVTSTDGKQFFTEGRWGKLVAGTEDYIRRIGTTGPDYRAMRIVRSEMYSSLQTAAIEFGRSNVGSTGMYRWVMQDGRDDWGCECEEYDGQLYKEEDVPSYPHPNCHTAGTLVLTSKGNKKIQDLKVGEYVITKDKQINRICGFYETKYKGIIFIFKTESGKEVRVTPEHKLFVNGDFITADRIQLGDYFQKIRSNTKPFSFVKAESKQFPFFRRKKLTFFSISNGFSRTGMPISTIDFDGQTFVREGNIDIEYVESKIWDWLFSNKGKSVKHNLFIFGSDSIVIKLGSFNFFKFWHLSSGNGGVTGGSRRLEAVKISPSNSFLCIWNIISGRKKASVNNIPRDAKTFGYSFNRKTFFAKKVLKNRGINVDFSTHNDKIISIETEYVNESVYNIRVENDETYFANSILSHNCGCTIVPEIMNMDDFVQMMKDYKDGIDTPDSRKMDVWASKEGLTIVQS